MDSAANTRILANAEHWSTALGWRVVCDGFLQVLAGSRQRPKAAPRKPKGIVSDDRERGVFGALRQAQQRFPELSRCVQLWPCPVKPVQTKQDRGKLWRLAHLLTQRACLGVGVLHLGGCVPFGYLQCRAEGDVEGQGVLGPLRRLWQGREQFNASGQVADGFQMGRAVAGLFTRSLPVAHRLLGTARRSVMLGHQLGLSLDGLGKACLGSVLKVEMDCD
jgi:hypothetical protein